MLGLVFLCVLLVSTPCFSLSEIWGTELESPVRLFSDEDSGNFSVPSSMSCQDLDGVGSLNTTCTLNSNLRFDSDLYVYGTGNLNILGRSEGGIKLATQKIRGKGGGRVKLLLNDTIHLNGTVSADGGDAGEDGGGGSGGSICIRGVKLDVEALFVSHNAKSPMISTFHSPSPNSILQATQRSHLVSPPVLSMLDSIFPLRNYSIFSLTRIVSKGNG